MIDGAVVALLVAVCHVAAAAAAAERYVRRQRQDELHGRLRHADATAAAQDAIDGAEGSLDLRGAAAVSGS